MAPGSTRWRREELLLVLNLYHRIPFGRMHHRNPDVIAIAEHIGRTPGAVAYKLANFAALDPGLDRRGMGNYSKADEAIWHEFATEPERLVAEAEKLQAELVGTSLFLEVEQSIPEGLATTERMALVRARVSQAYFRRMILARFDGTCCITGLRVPPLLVASHIVRWSDAPELRMSPVNGLCLNALHDRAFEIGLITVRDDLTIQVADRLRDEPSSPVRDLILSSNGQRLRAPANVVFSLDLFRQHRERVS